MINRIKSEYSNFSKTEKIIADYFIKNYSEIISVNIHELANEIGTSSASISRFVKKLFGLNFAQTKIELAKLIEKNDIGKARDLLDWATDLKDVPVKIEYYINKVFEGIVKYNGIEVFEGAIDLFLKADNIYIYGIGSSGIVAQDLMQKLIKLKKRAYYIMDSNYGVMSSLLTGKNDVVFAISNSGNTKEVNLAVEKSKKNGAKIVSLTSNIKCNLSNNSDIRIITPNIENETSRLGAIFSRYGQLFVIDLLFIGLAKKLNNNPNELLDEYKELFNALKNNKKK